MGLTKMQCGCYSDKMNGQAGTGENFTVEEMVTPVALWAPSITISSLFLDPEYIYEILRTGLKNPSTLMLYILIMP